MFTGIVQGAFPVVECSATGAGLRLGVQLDADSVSGLSLGASVAVSGVCLTVVEIDAERVSFDVVGETLDKTRLGALRVGDRVNIERSLRAGDELGGHIVSGHVMGMAVVTRVEVVRTDHRIWFGIPADWLRYVLHKGFITVDGCSLTVGEVSSEGFCVHLIPETLRRTTLSELSTGSRVNVELDPMTVATVTTVERVLRARGLTGEHV